MKKVVSLLLVLLLSLGMVTTASAWVFTTGGSSVDRGDITLAPQDGTSVADGVNADTEAALIAAFKGVKSGNSEMTAGSKSAATSGSTEELEGAVIIRGSAYVSWDWAKNVRNPRLTSRVRVAKGSQFLDSHKLVGVRIGNATVLGFEFSIHEKIKSIALDGHDLEFRAIVMHGSTEILSTEISEKVGNAHVTVDKDDNYVYADKGLIVAAEEYNSKIAIELADNVVLETRVFKDRNYWAWADDVWWDGVDDAMKTQYKDIQEVLNLDWLGYNDATTKVNLQNKFAGDNYYVYGVNEDGGLFYMGRSNQLLDLTSKYYLSIRELNVDSDIEPEDDIDDEYDDVPEINPITGGDDVYPSNVNDNPGTGK